MSSGQTDDGIDESGGRLVAGRMVAHRIADAVFREPLVVTGTICAMTTVRMESASSCMLVLDDGTGLLGLIFVGRPQVPGLVVGTRCRVEGTAGLRRGRLVVWNPGYRLEPSDG